MLCHQRQFWAKDLRRGSSRLPSLLLQLNGGVVRRRGSQAIIGSTQTKLKPCSWRLGKQTLLSEHAGAAWILSSAGDQADKRFISAPVEGELVGDGALRAPAPAGSPLLTTALIEGGWNVGVFSLRSTEDVPGVFLAISAAQEAAVLGLGGPSALQVTPSQTRAAIRTVRRLQEMRGQLLRNARRLQRLHAFSGVAKRSRHNEENTPGAASLETTDGAVCLLPQTVVASLRASGERILAGVDAVATRQLLLVCYGFAQLGCCHHSLAAAALKRVLLGPSQLHAYEVALGLQLSALVLKQTALLLRSQGGPAVPHQAQPLRPPHGILSQLEAADASLGGHLRVALTSSAGCDSSPGHVGFRPSQTSCTGADKENQAATWRTEPETLQRLCLLVASRLLALLEAREDLRKVLRLETCVRTAKACATLADQRLFSLQPLGLPGAFAAAVACAKHSLLACLPKAPGDAPAASARIGAGGVPGASLPATPPRAHGASALPQRLPQAAGTFAASGESERLLMAALSLRVQKSQAPRVAVLLLREASARRHCRGKDPQKDQRRTNELVACAMTAAATGVPTQATRRKLLLQLLRGLQYGRPQVQQQEVNPRSRRQIPNGEEQREQAETPAGKQISHWRPSAMRLSPVVLASVCHSLASSGVRLRRANLTFLFDVIHASFQSAIAKEDSAACGSAVCGSETPLGLAGSCTCQPVVADGAAAILCSACSGDNVTDAARAASGRVSHLRHSSEIATFYGEWCIVFWSAAKLLNAAASSLPPKEPILLAAQRLLARQLLARLLALLPIADPPDVAQIVEALRLLLLADVKAEASSELLGQVSLNGERPLLLRQRLLPANELLSSLLTLGRHFMQHSNAFGSLEVLAVLRFFVQLDLLYYLDIQHEPNNGIKASGEDAWGKFARRQHASSSLRECAGGPTQVFSAGIVRCALSRLLKLKNHLPFDRAMHAELPSHQRQQAEPSCELYAHGLLRSLALKYPEQLERLPKAMRRRVLRHVGGYQALIPYVREVK